MVGTAMQPLVADMVYTCQRAGAALLTVSLHFAVPGIAPVEFSAQKECAARPRQGLNLGTSTDQADDVIRDGTSLWSIATATQRLIPYTTQNIQLFWALRPTGGVDDTASQLLAPLRARVTPLSKTGAAQGATPVAEVRRWRRALLLQSGTEKKQRAQGLWGMENQNNDDSLLKVHFRGELGNGGQLQTVPAGSPEAPPSLSVELECLHAGTALVELEVSTAPAYQPYRPAVIAFLKQCGGLHRDGFDVSTHAFAAGDVGNLVHNGKPIGKLPDLGNTLFGGALYWRDTNPTLDSPKVTLSCTHDLVKTNMFDAVAAAHDTVPTGRKDISMQCLRDGTADCTLSFSWHTYDNADLHFRKVCGGVRTDVDVQSDLPNAPLVLLAGKAEPAWSLDPQVTLPPEEDKTTFTISLDKALKPGGEALKLAPPQVRVFRPDVCKAFIIGEMVDGGEVEAEDGSDVELQMECLTTGTSRIEVTLPIASTDEFNPLTFAFVKKCIVVSYWQQWWFLSVMCFVGVFLLSCTVLLGCVCKFQKGLSEELKAGGGAKATEMKPAAEEEGSDDEYG
jgi:hypothetical protein